MYYYSENSTNSKQENNTLYFMTFQEDIDQCMYIGQCISHVVNNIQCIPHVQQVLDYRDLDYRDPRNTGIYKKFHSSITAIFLLIHPRNTGIFRMPL